MPTVFKGVGRAGCHTSTSLTGAKIESVGLFPQDSLPFEPNWVHYEFVIFCFLVNLIDCLWTLNDLREALDSMQANYIVDEP